MQGSQRYRNFEDCLLPKPTFAALRAEGRLAIGVAEDAATYLTAKQETLAAALADVAAQAEARTLREAILKAGTLKITPLRPKS